MNTGNAKSFGKRLAEDLARNKELYLLVLPVLVFYAVFHYGPMYGASIAFQNFRPALGIGGSEWIGLTHFKDFFSSVFFTRVVFNTVRVSLFRLVLEFPAPILLALLINEVKHKYFARTVQTITYMPFFISIIVVAGMIRTFVGEHGLITQFLSVFGFQPTNLLNHSSYFLQVLIVSDIWQSVGWGSIIFLAALQGIDMEQYEAAAIDGAGRFKQTIHITLPGILPTIIILFILRMGTMLSVGAEKILLLYSPLTWEVSDVISTFVYRRGLLDAQYSYASAVGLFNSVVNIAFLLTANYLSKKVSQDNTSLF
jgi:putative aldouronate transport system permease protein